MKQAIKFPAKGKKISKSWMIVIFMYSYFVLFSFGEMVSQLWLRFLANDAQVMRFERIGKIDPLTLQFSGHPYLNYYPTPNFVSGECRHNSLGYRGEEFQGTKPDSVYRIVLLGSSTTYSSHVADDDKTYPVLLQQNLRDKSGHDTVEVINAGVSGHTSWETLANFQYRILELDPDLVIVSLGIDDVNSRLADDYRSDNSGYRQCWSRPKTSWWEYSCLLRVISRGLHLTEPKIDVWDWMLAEDWKSDDIRTTEADKVEMNLQRLGENPPLYFKRNLTNLVQIAGDNEIKIVLATEAVSPHAESELTEFLMADHFQTALVQHANVMRELSEEHNVPLFDFDKVMPKDRILWVDHLHVNEAGSLIKAELLADFLNKTCFNRTVRQISYVPRFL